MDCESTEQKKYVGLVPGLSFEEYCAAPGINQSKLKDIARTPKFFWSQHLDPERAEKADKKHFRQGRQIHAAVLEPERFDEEFVPALDPKDHPHALRTLDEFKRHLKLIGVELSSKAKRDDYVTAMIENGAARLVWDFIESEFDVQNVGKTIIHKAEHEQALAVRDAVLAHPVAKEIFREGEAELSMFWTDAETGLPCKARVDWLMKSDLGDPAAIVDPKTTEDAGPGEFRRSIYNFDYHVQAAFYLDGFSAVTGKPQPLDAFIFAALEKVAPYDLAFYCADAEMIEIGRREYRKRLKLYAECLKTNNWPGLPEEIQAISLPPWALKGEF